MMGLRVSLLWGFQKSAVRGGMVGPTVEKKFPSLKAMCQIQAANLHTPTSGKSHQSRLREEPRTTGAKSIIFKGQELLSLGQPKNQPPNNLTQVKSGPPPADRNASEAKGKAPMSSAQATKRTDRPVSILNENAGVSDRRAIARDLAPNQRPSTIPMSSQETNTSDPSNNSPFSSKRLHEVVALLATARKGRGWSVAALRTNLETQRNLFMDERYVYIPRDSYPMPYSAM
ncbi:hypothetical protein FRC01_010996 [Tulasnella sp. 417]|nr:hypothetical protein FRC01_010996 [Tulasnella sp. 417]